MHYNQIFTIGHLPQLYLRNRKHVPCFYLVLLDMCSITKGVVSGYATHYLFYMYSILSILSIHSTLLLTIYSTHQLSCGRNLELIILLFNRNMSGSLGE